jgi:TRAP-type C4-dicarboxylate transport system permease small subunit
MTLRPHVQEQCISNLGTSIVLKLVITLNRGVDRLARFMNGCAGWLFVACAGFIAFDVLARKFLGFSSQSTLEVSGYMLGVGIAWGLAGALEDRAHVRVDVLIQQIPAKARRYLHWLALACLVVFVGFLAYGAYQTTMESWEFKATDNSLIKTPLIIPQGLWLIGIAVFGIMAMLRLLEVALLLPHGDIAAIEHLTGPKSYVEEADETLEALGVEQQLDESAQKGAQAKRDNAAESGEVRA